MAADAIALPAAITHGVMHLTDERRYDVPVTLVCPEFTPGRAREWIDGGEVWSWRKRRDWSTSTSTPVTGRWPHELVRVLADCTQTVA